MTEKDVMVGDWFRFRYTTISNREVVHTFRISQIENQLEQYFVWGDGFGRMCHPENLEPIPLTPEILEKNGFEHERDAGYIYDDYNGIIVAYSTFISRLRIIKNLNILFDSQDYSDVYVHTLQHALHLCGIQKDIEL